MSLLRTIRTQLGLSNTPAENHFFDGSTVNQLKLTKGTPEAPGIDVMTVDAGGYAAFAKQPVFRARASADQSLSGVTKILFPTENTDTDSNYDASISRFVAPVAGYYQFNATARLGATGWSNAFTYIYKNGAQASVGGAARLPSGINTTTILVVSDVVNLAAGDYVEIFASIDGTSQIADFNDAATCSNFSGFLLRTM